jgi:sec-independent protein translocase protein TatA
MSFVYQKYSCIFTPSLELSKNIKHVVMNHLLFLDSPVIIVIALIFLLLFGGKKIPELMKGLGKGVKSFKEGMADIEDEIKKEPNSEDKKDTTKKKDE